MLSAYQVCSNRMCSLMIAIASLTLWTGGVAKLIIGNAPHSLSAAEAGAVQAYVNIHSFVGKQDLILPAPSAPPSFGARFYA